MFLHMRTILIIMAVLVILFTISQLYGPMVGGTEEQAYTVVQRYDELEIRHYPPAMMASVDVTDSTYRSASGTGFRRLAGYIFGDNEAGEKIAMTAPVHMGMEEGGMRMSFVLPAERALEPLPDPTDRGVQLHLADEEFVAVLRFSGFMRDAGMSDMKAKLLIELERNGLLAIGPVRFLGYDPPWQLIGRRNEVVVPVRWPRP